MSQKEESAIRTRIANYIRKEGGWVIVTSGSTKTSQGTPDIIGSLWHSNLEQWVHVAIEVKTELGKPSPLQVETLYRMGLKGYLPMIATGIRDVQEIVTDYGNYMKFFLGHQYPVWQKMTESHGDEYGIWKR